MKWLLLMTICLTSLLIWLTTQNHAIGCAVVPQRGFSVAIRDEFALIVWDPTTKIEHFTRVAKFDTDAPDLGFLVPTPSVPTIVEVDGLQIRSTLHLQTEAKVEYKTKFVSRFGLGPWPFDDSTRASLSDGVEVLGRYDVAGYEATVLRGEDAAAVKTWLDEHEYPTSDSLEDWLKIYTDQRWVITAFKLSKNGESHELTSKAVRMSFKTEAPFYPYREPFIEDTPVETTPRKLRVFLLSDARYDGRIGANGSWPGRTLWSGQMTDYYHQDLHREINVDVVFPKWLTEFVDDSSPRRGIDELYFHKSESHETIERPVVFRTVSHDRFYPGWTRVIVSTMIVAPVILFGTILYWIRRRRKANSQEDV